MARRFQRQSQVRRRTPNRSWSGTQTVAFTVIPAASKVLLSTFVLSNPNIDETILRVVGGVGVASDQNVASEAQIGAVGLHLITDNAFAIGITAIPDPITDITSDGWFMYQLFNQRNNFATAVGFDSIQMMWYPIDSTAKRVIVEGSRVAVVAANAHATNGMQIGLSFRMLMQVRGT